MKNECTRQILVPMRMDAMRREIRCYAVWYNRHRPNQTLGGRTPWEVCGAPLSLVVGYLEGRRHLPVVEIRRAA